MAIIRTAQTPRLLLRRTVFLHVYAMQARWRLPAPSARRVPLNGKPAARSRARHRKCPNQGAKKHQGKQPHGRGLAAEELNRREQSDNPGDEKIPTPQGNQFKTADGKKSPVTRSITPTSRHHGPNQPDGRGLLSDIKMNLLITL